MNVFGNADVAIKFVAAIIVLFLLVAWMHDAFMTDFLTR